MGKLENTSSCGLRCPGAMARQAPARSLMLESNRWWVHAETQSRHAIPRNPPRHFGDKSNFSKSHYHGRALEQDKYESESGVHHHHHHHYHLNSSKPRVPGPGDQSWYHHWAKATSSLSWVNASEQRVRRMKDEVNSDRTGNGARNCLEMLPPMTQIGSELRVSSDDQGAGVGSWSGSGSGNKESPTFVGRVGELQESQDEVSEADQVSQLNPQELAKWLCTLPEQCKLSLKLRKDIAAKVLRLRIYSRQFAEELRAHSTGTNARLPFDLPDQRAVVWLRHAWQQLQRQRIMSQAALTYTGRSDRNAQKLSVMTISEGGFRDDSFQANEEVRKEIKEHEDENEHDEHDEHEEWDEHENYDDHEHYEDHEHEHYENSDDYENYEDYGSDDHENYEDHEHEYYDDHESYEGHEYHEDHEQVQGEEHDERAHGYGYEDDEQWESDNSVEERGREHQKSGGDGIFSLVEGAHTHLENATVHAEDEWDENEWGDMHQRRGGDGIFSLVEGAHTNLENATVHAENSRALNAHTYLENETVQDEDEWGENEL